MANTKLTDAQRVILAAAAARPSGLVLPTPKSLGNNRGTLGVLLKSLLTRALITERPHIPDEELWRETPELGRTTLVISTEGLKAIGIEPEMLEDGIALPGPPAGQGTVDRPPAQAATPKADSKLGAMTSALRQPGGATISDLTGATGWQKHSVRGAMSGSLKKKLKLEVTSDVVEGRGRVYRIAVSSAE